MAQQAFHKRVGNYIFIQSIGRGAFAEVFKGMHQTTHEEVAIKMISRARMRDEEVQIEKEIRILKELKHQNIVNFLDYQKTQNHYYLVFEYCKHGDLEHFIRDNYNGKVPEYAAQKFIQQIVEGIKAMKAKNIVHRDLKLANILVSKDFVLKIADFGLARYLEKEDNLLRTMVGTPLNMDPFILERKGYNEKCDIWSLGVIFYQILVGKPPYNPGRGADIHDLLDLIKKQPLTFPEDIPLSDSFKGLIRRMLVYEPSKRMTFEELFEHEWITGTFKVEDPNKPTENEMDASELLKSQFLDKKMEEKKDKIRDKRLASKQDQSAKGQLQPEKQKIVAPKQDNPIEKIGEKERRNEIFGGVFLAKVYEIFRGRVAKLREYVKRINQMVVPNEVNQDDHVAIVQALMLMELLQLLKEVLNSKFTITEEMSEEVVFENDFKALWDFVISHKDIIENLYSTNDATLEIPDLYSEIKQDYLETFETISNKLESMRDIFERFKGHNSEQLLMDCLIHLSENTAYQEFLEENNEAKIERYKICIQISEFMQFKKHFKFTQFRIVRKDEEESKEFDLNEFPKCIGDYLKNGFNFKYLPAMIQKDEYKKSLLNLKNSFTFTDLDEKNPSDFDLAMKKLHTLILKRVSDLQKASES